MKKWTLNIFFLFSILFVSGCSIAQNGLGLPQASLVIDPSLPKVEGIKTISDIESVAFEWKKSEDSRVAGYYLFRSDPKGNNQTIQKVAQKINDRYSTHFVDNGLKPNTIYFYQMATFNEKGQVSDRSNIVEVKTRELGPVTFAQAISNYPRRVKILWRPHTNDRIQGYVIERNEGKGDEWNKLTEIDNRLLAEYIDKDLKDNATYRYRILALTFDGLLAPPSPIAEATTKPLPKEVKGIITTLDLPKRIELSWLPNMEKDIAYYKIYSADSKGGTFTKLNEVNATRYIDSIMEDGKERFYKLTAVDLDGLESAMPADERMVRGMTLPIPERPELTSATIQDRQAIIKWKKVDPRSTTYIVTKKTKEWLSGETFTFNNIKETSITDKDIVPGVKYRYSVAAVDKNGLVSEFTDEIELYLPASMKQE